ncbi:MAG: phosphotransferase family protein [Holophagales bacterium]|nr:phosphotransferase family protein [Holophagales bacterium]
MDSSQPTRSGEELPLDKLEAYLEAQIPEASRPLVVEQFPSGFSNLTYLLRMGELELVLRRPPFGNRVATAHDMGREFLVLSALQNRFPLAPKPYLYCEDDDVIGAPFYVMERRHGVVLRRRLPQGLELSPVIAERLSQGFIDQLASLHTLDYGAIGLGELGKPEGYVERQVRGWIRRYEKAQTDTWPELDRVAAWLVDGMPAESGAGLVHNDYKYDNVILDPQNLTRLVAVLDWEMCTVGDPMLDLGTTLSYWVQANDPPELRAAAFGPTHVPGSLSRRELAERYAERTGADISNLVFYICFGFYKLAVIVQQIYWRYAQGHTRDRRFAELDQMVGLLGRVAAHTLETGKV